MPDDPIAATRGAFANPVAGVQSLALEKFLARLLLRSDLSDEEQESIRSLPGEVIETETRRIAARLTDEHGTAVQSEKMVEIDFRGDRPIRAGDQFGLGRVREP